MKCRGRRGQSKTQIQYLTATAEVNPRAQQLRGRGSDLRQPAGKAPTTINQAIAEDPALIKTIRKRQKISFNPAITRSGWLETENSWISKRFIPVKKLKQPEEPKASHQGRNRGYRTAQSRNQLQTRSSLRDETNDEFGRILKRWLQTSGEKEKTIEEARPNFQPQPVEMDPDQRQTGTGTETGSKPEELRYSRNEIMRYFGSMNPGDMTSWMESYVDRMDEGRKAGRRKLSQADRSRNYSSWLGITGRSRQKNS